MDVQGPSHTLPRDEDDTNLISRRPSLASLSAVFLYCVPLFVLFFHSKIFSSVCLRYGNSSTTKNSFSRTSRHAPARAGSFRSCCGVGFPLRLLFVPTCRARVGTPGRPLSRAGQRSNVPEREGERDLERDLRKHANLPCLTPKSPGNPLLLVAALLLCCCSQRSWCLLPLLLLVEGAVERVEKHV